MDRRAARPEPLVGGGRVAGLAPADRPAGRLAILTALASYQVSDAIIDEFRRGGGTDRALIEVTSWAALVAARRVGSWIADPRPADRRLSSG